MADDEGASGGRPLQSLNIGTVGRFVNNPKQYVEAGSLHEAPASEHRTRTAHRKSPAAEKPTDIFISHRHVEQRAVQRIVSAIAESYHGEIALYASAVDPPRVGENWIEEIDRALRSARVLLAIVGPGSLESHWIHFEAGFAWARSIPLVFLCYGGVGPPSLPLPYSTMMGLDLMDPSWLGRLVYGLTKRIPHAAQRAPVIEALALKLSAELATELTPVHVR